MNLKSHRFFENICGIPDCPFSWTECIQKSISEWSNNHDALTGISSLYRLGLQSGSIFTQEFISTINRRWRRMLVADKAHFGDCPPVNWFSMANMCSCADFQWSTYSFRLYHCKSEVNQTAYLRVSRTDPWFRILFHEQTQSTRFYPIESSINNKLHINFTFKFVRHSALLCAPSRSPKNSYASFRRIRVNKNVYEFKKWSNPLRLPPFSLSAVRAGTKFHMNLRYTYHTITCWLVFFTWLWLPEN